MLAYYNGFAATAILLLVNPTVARAADSFAPKSMAYVLQADKLARSKTAAIEKLSRCDRDLIVLDTNNRAGPNGEWSTAELKQIRNGKSGRSVVAYLSIGEAESYRPYWQKGWTDAKGQPTALAPRFLGPQNPDWPGNFRAKYWQAQWQTIIGKAVDAVVEQGFDGLYLDIVDGFEFYEFDAAKKDYIDNRKNPETGHSYREDMVAWVMAIASRARAKAGEKFLIIPQNGSQLLADPRYIAAISAIGVEDLFTDGNKKQPKHEVAQRLKDLKLATAAHLPVMVIEYGTQEKARAVSKQGATQQGFTLLLTDRQLTGRDLIAPSGR